jgi:hypothetical protein
MRKMIGGFNYIGKSTEPMPVDDVEDGETLYLVDTKKAFIWYDGEWWPC